MLKDMSLRRMELKSFGQNSRHPRHDKKRIHILLASVRTVREFRCDQIKIEVKKRLEKGTENQS